MTYAQIVSVILVFSIYALIRLFFYLLCYCNKKIKNLRKADAFPSCMNQETAEQSAGSLIGTDRYARKIELTDQQANQHTLVLGTTGSGKTVTVCNVVESAINRALPLIYIDGKGDYGLAQRIARYGHEHNRPVSIFAMNGESVVYNPLASGGFTSKKIGLLNCVNGRKNITKSLPKVIYSLFSRSWKLAMFPATWSVSLII